MNIIMIFYFNWNFIQFHNIPSCNVTSQGAGRVFDPPKKFTIDETPIF